MQPSARRHLESTQSAACIEDQGPLMARVVANARIIAGHTQGKSPEKARPRIRQGGLDWCTHGADWPNRGSSRFVKVADLTWHVQIMGNGPVLLLAHGAGASTSSWRDLMPSLARYFTVVAPDLPGHAFTGAPQASGMTLNGMAIGLGALMQELGISPAVAVGHSAGAAILAGLVLSAGIAAPAVLVALNGAMLPMPGVAGRVFRAAAKVLAHTPVAPRVFSFRARRPGIVEKMIANTGSRLDAPGLSYYGRLLSNPEHVRNVIRMMAHWEPRHAGLASLPCRLVLVAADGDSAIPPKVARQTAGLVPGCELIVHKGYGHLSHEEAPEETVAFILQAARASGVLVDSEGAGRPAVLPQRSSAPGHPLEAAA
jgi:magnesium chelatase accessory protein